MSGHEVDLITARMFAIVDEASGRQRSNIGHLVTEQSNASKGREPIQLALSSLPSLRPAAA